MEYKRVLVKLSGEALGSKENILEPSVLEDLLNQVKTLVENGIQVGISVGGGNIFRGKVSKQLGLGEDTAPADYMGMLAITMNSIALNTFFNKHGVKTVLRNSFEIENIAKKCESEESIQLLEEGNVIIFGGGTGKPYLTSDTGSAMRAIDIKADAILMAKNGVDGVYDSNPIENPDAKFISTITFDEYLEKDLKVLDQEAIKTLKGHNIHIVMFNMNTPNNIVNVLQDENTKKTIIKEK